MSKREDLVNDSINHVEAVEKSTQKAFEPTINEWDALNTESIRSGNYTPATAKRVIQNNLVKSGYYVQVNDYLNAGYQSVINESFDMYKSLTGEAFQFSQESLEHIQALKIIDLDNFTANAQRATTAYTTTAINTQVTGIFNTTVLDNLIKTTNKMINDTNTWVSTSTSGLYRTANTSIATDNGLSMFEYIGIIDGRTRPFCKQHVGEVRSIPEWNLLDNGQINPVSVYGGGYRCRHSLVAVA